MLKVSMIRETELFFDEVLKNDLSLTNFVASDFSMLNGRLAQALRHPRRGRLGVPQGDAAPGQPPRRRADDGRRAQGDGQRHHDLARAARRLGAGPHPRHAAEPAARRRGRRSTRTSAAPSRSANNSPSTARSPRAQPATQDRSAGLRAGELRRASAAGATITAPPGTAKPVIDRRPADAVSQGQESGPHRRDADGEPFREHRRVQANPLEGQGPDSPAHWPSKLLTYATGRAPAPATEREIEAIVAADKRQELRLPDARSRDRPEQELSEPSEPPRQRPESR